LYHQFQIHFILVQFHDGFYERDDGQAFICFYYRHHLTPLQLQWKQFQHISIGYYLNCDRSIKLTKVPWKISW